jgi:hypothetical protein
VSIIFTPDAEVKIQFGIGPIRGQLTLSGDNSTAYREAFSLVFFGTILAIIG